MWLITPRGFYSAVQHKDDPRFVQVRARAREDLEALVELPAMDRYADQILDTPPPSDYRWRLPKVRVVDWAEAALELAVEIDYTNFKDAVKARNPERAKVYMDVWTVLRRIQGWRPWRREEPLIPGAETVLDLRVGPNGETEDLLEGDGTE